jgi:hypothetical protein
MFIFVRERITTPNLNNKQLRQMSQQIERREEKLFGTKRNKKKTKKLLREEIYMVARNDYKLCLLDSAKLCGSFKHDADKCYLFRFQNSDHKRITKTETGNTKFRDANKNRRRGVSTNSRSTTKEVQMKKYKCYASCFTCSLGSAKFVLLALLCLLARFGQVFACFTAPSN